MTNNADNPKTVDYLDDSSENDSPDAPKELE